jgi:hypothetical protein
MAAITRVRPLGHYALVAVGHKELKKNGAFVLHGFAKFVVVKEAGAPGA